MTPTLALEKLWAALEAGPAFSLTEMRNFHAAANPLTIQALLDELEARKVDAERYRWLREQIQSGPFTIAKSDSWALQPWSGDDPDARIDAARAALTKE